MQKNKENIAKLQFNREMKEDSSRSELKQLKYSDIDCGEQTYDLDLCEDYPEENVYIVERFYHDDTKTAYDTPRTFILTVYEDGSKARSLKRPNISTVENALGFTHVLKTYNVEDKEKKKPKFFLYNDMTYELIPQTWVKLSPERKAISKTYLREYIMYKKN